MDAKEIFISATKDYILKSVPYRKEDGTFVFCNGMLFILNKLIYQPLRTLFFNIRSLEQDKVKLQRTAIEISNEVKLEQDRYQTERTSFEEQLVQLGTSFETESREIQKFEDKVTDRHLFLPEPATPLHSNIPSEKPKTKLLGLLFSFLFCEFLTTGLLWYSLRDFLSIQEVAIRSAGILAIFLTIHFAGNKKNTHGVAYTYFQIFCFIMLVSAMFMSPILSVLYPIDFQHNNIWDLSSPTETTIPMQTTPLLINFYRKIPSIEAVLLLLGFVAMQQFVRPLKLENTQDGHNSNAPILTDPMYELNQIRQSKMSKRSRIEQKIEKVKSELNQMDKIHNTTLENLLSELRKVNSSMQVKHAEIQSKQIQFDDLFNCLISELSNFAIEYKSNLSDDLADRGIFSNLSWPEESDIIKYYKLS